MAGDNREDIIEMAVSRLDERSPEAIAAEERKERERMAAGRRDYDQTIERRKDLRRRAMCHSVLGTPTAPLPAVPEPAPEPSLQDRGPSVGTLLATALFSAALGVGVTWLAIGENPPPAGPVEVVGTLSPAPAAAGPVPAKPPAPVAEPVPPPPGDEDQVREVIESWRSAWAGRDVDAYLACYSKDFVPANGLQHDAWASARRKNIAGRSSITVATNGLTLERLDETRMKVSFLQDYASGSHRETAQPKTLLVVRGDSGWKIAGEWQGDAPEGALDKP